MTKQKSRAQTMSTKTYAARAKKVLEDPDSSAGPELSPDIEAPATNDLGKKQAKKENNITGEVSRRREDEALSPPTVPFRPPPDPTSDPTSYNSVTPTEPERTFPGAVAVDSPLSGSASQPSTEQLSSTQVVSEPEPFLAQAEMVPDTPPIPLYAAQPMSSLTGPPPPTQSDREKKRLYWIIAILVVLVIVAVAAAVAAVFSTRNNSSPVVQGPSAPTEPATSPTEPATSPTSPPPPTQPPVELQACDADSDCVSGKCALDSYAPSVGTRKKVCCPSGTSIYLSSPDSAYFCTSIIPNGERCKGNRLCQSGICLDDGRCAAEGKANGSSCIENGDCQSLICLHLNRTCSANKLSEAASCGADGDCLNGACALDSYAPSTGVRKKVCCPSRTTKYLSSPDSAYFCTSNIPNGERCPISSSGNLLCQSGICLDDGRCAAEGKANGSSCIENGDCQSLICLQLNRTCSANKLPEAASCGTDGDCLNGACALDSYAPSTGVRKKVCCPSRTTTYLSSPDSAYFCTDNIPNGERCPTTSSGNRLCQSGLCLEGTCAAQ